MKWTLELTEDTGGMRCRFIKRDGKLVARLDDYGSAIASEVLDYYAEIIRNTLEEVTQ